MTHEIRLVDHIATLAEVGVRGLIDHLLDECADPLPVRGIELLVLSGLAVPLHLRLDLLPPLLVQVGAPPVEFIYVEHNIANVYSIYIKFDSKF